MWQNIALLPRFYQALVIVFYSYIISKMIISILRNSYTINIFSLQLATHHILGLCFTVVGNNPIRLNLFICLVIRSVQNCMAESFVSSFDWKVLALLWQFSSNSNTAVGYKIFTFSISVFGVFVWPPGNESRKLCKIIIVNIFKSLDTQT